MAANNPTRCKCPVKIRFHVELFAKGLWKRVDITLCPCLLVLWRWKIYWKMYQITLRGFAKIDRVFRWAAPNVAIYTLWETLKELGFGRQIWEIIDKIKLFLN